MVPLKPGEIHTIRAAIAARMLSGVEECEATRCVLEGWVLRKFRLHAGYTREGMARRLRGHGVYVWISLDGVRTIETGRGGGLHPGLLQGWPWVLACGITEFEEARRAMYAQLPSNNATL